VDDGYLRAELTLLYAPDEDARASVPRGTIDVSYVCSVCGSPWSFQQVRNTGRCPSCGSGLRRANDS